MTANVRTEPVTYVSVGLLGLVLGLTVVGLTGSRVVAVVSQMAGLWGTASITAFVAHKRRDQYPERARGWMLVALGLAVFGASGIPRLFALIEAGPYTLVELGGFPFVAAGLIRVRRTLTAPARARRLAALDGTLVGTAVAVLTWTMLFEPFVERRSTAEVLAVGLFPLATMLLMSYWVLPLLLLDRRNPVARWFVAINLGILLVDLTVAALRLTGTTEQDDLRGLYGLVIVLVALATGDPRCWTAGDLSPSEAFLDRERIILISASLAVVPSILLGSEIVGTTPNLLIPGAGAAVMVSIVAVRLRGALRDADNLQSRLRHLAEIDALTGLPNRRAAEERLELIQEAGGEVAVMFIDLDGFKAVNDRRGHQVGDLLLCEVAERLRGCTRDGDLVARFGGDEFVVLSPGLPVEQAEMIARRLQRTVAGSYDLEGEVEEVGASVGVAVDELGPHCGVSDLLEAADDAMYEAKAAGKGQVILATAAGV